MKHTVFALSILMGLLYAAPARAQGTPYDCFFVYTFTSATPQTGQSNASSQSPCVAWRVTYTTTGFSSATVAFQTSSDNSSYSNVTNTQCSDSVRTSCVLEGASPITAGVQGNSAYRIYAKFVRVNVSSVTGSGAGQVVVYGYKGTSASIVLPGSGGGGSGAVGNGLAGQTAAYLADGTTVNGTGNACTSASALGFQLDGSDETTLLNTTFTAFFAAGGGCLAIDAGKSLRADGQIVLPNNGNAPNFFQPPIRITGAVGGEGEVAAYYGSRLDLRYHGSGISAYGGGPKILTLGQGIFEIDHLTIEDGGTDCGAYVMTTGTSVWIHHTAFMGTTSNSASPCNDAIILGGTNQPGATYTGTIADWMWGNGNIDHNRFVLTRRGIFAQSSVNSITIKDNVFSGANTGANQTADKSQMAFYGYGTGANASRGTIISDNLLEISYDAAACGIYLANSENFKITGNGLWDGGASSVAFCGTSTATLNTFDKSNFVDLTGTTYSSGLSSNNYFPWRTVPFGFDGGGTALSGTTVRCGIISFGGYINQFSMQADQSGNATVTVKTVAIGSYTGPGSASDISNGGETMAAAKLTDTTLTGWTRTIAPQTMVCVELSSPATITWLSGSIQVWEGR